MKHIAIATLAALLMTVGAQANDNTDLMQLVRQLQQQVQQQQSQIDQLTNGTTQSRIAEMVEVAVDERIDTEGFSALKEVGSVVTLEDADSLHITGDVLLRYQYAELHRGWWPPTTTLVSLLACVLGLGWTERRLGSRHRSSSAVLTDARQADSVFEFGSLSSSQVGTLTLNIDYAYGTHNWDGYALTTRSGSRTPTTPATSLWDNDLRFSGATATADLEAAFVTTGLYSVMNNGYWR